jgi:hypothetical protein
MGGRETVNADFGEVDRRLRQILEPFRARLVASRDGPDGLTLEIPGLEGKPWGYVAGVRPGKRYVSFYLMAVYAFPDLVESMSPELRRRMQGKSCFNFTTVDEPLFAELARIIEAGFERYLDLAAEVAHDKPPARSR